LIAFVAGKRILGWQEIAPEGAKAPTNFPR